MKNMILSSQTSSKVVKNEADTQLQPKRKKKFFRAELIPAYVISILYCIFVLAPLYIVFITSVKTVGEAADVHFSWFAHPVTFEAYKTVISKGVIFRGLLNTLLYYIPPTIVGLLVSALSAYGFSKMKWRGRNVLFSILMVTMMVPGTVTMSASYLIYDTISWVGTPLPLMIPGMFGSIGMVFFLRQYMMGIPDELIEAGKIDGMGDLKTFFIMILPLSLPALAAQGILSFIGCYNDYLNPLLYLGYDENVHTLQLVIQHMANSNLTELPMQMAACIVAMAPMLIIYFFFQNFILKGISISSGLKG